MIIQHERQQEAEPERLPLFVPGEPSTLPFNDPGLLALNVAEMLSQADLRNVA